jgi:hypothetical protein
MAQERSRIYSNLNIPVFRQVVGKISSFALKVLLEHSQTANSVSACTGAFKRTMGMPCIHDFVQKQRIESSFEITDFHDQWKLQLPESYDTHTLDFDILLGEISERFSNSTPQQREAALQALRQVNSALLSTSGLLEPAILQQNARGRPTGALNRQPHNISSTRRNPSGFEYAERSPRLCGICRQTGHYRRNCPQRQ